jgi:tRNA pseudouridine38-40 synthase
MFKALVKAGAVSDANAVDHRKVDVQRAARTDAGVHAAGNVYVIIECRECWLTTRISLKMIVAPPLPDEHPNLASYVNSFLPDQIRMWGWVRTINSFQARTYVPSIRALKDELILGHVIRECTNTSYLPTAYYRPPRMML